MVDFVATFRVTFILCTLLTPITDTEKIKGHLPDVGIISSFLEQFIRPYMESIKFSNVTPRATEETKVDKAIRLKVLALKPLLQDGDEVDKPKNENDNNITLEGNDETTIIEFVPKATIQKKTKVKSAVKESKTETDPFQKNINKYKQLRKTIQKLLDKEKTVRSTKKLIVRTLDDMIAQLIERQCTWKPLDSHDLKNRIFKGTKNTRRSMKKLQRLSNKDWMTLRKQYLNFLKFNEGKEDTFMKQFHDFFTSVINDTWNLSHRYKVRCQLVKADGDAKDDKQFLRDEKIGERNLCDNFKICSDELKEFLTNFYMYVNDTSVSTFRNYAAMYIRDVNADTGLDKDIVVSVLENISNTAEKKVSKIFRKELDAFTLDKNKNKEENIKNINNFITGTVDQVKKILKKNLDYELGAMKTKLFATVKDDLNVNLRVDMDNLGRLFVNRVCALFVLCNGRYAARRQDGPWTFRPKNTDNIYVKVQLTLDDELKESIARGGGYAKPWQGKDMTHRFMKNFGVVAEKKYNSNLNVTRTTISPTTDSSTAVNSTDISSTTADAIASRTSTAVSKPTSTLPVQEITASASMTIVVNNAL